MPLRFFKIEPFDNPAFSMMGVSFCKTVFDVFYYYDIDHRRFPTWGSPLTSVEDGVIKYTSSYCRRKKILEEYETEEELMEEIDKLFMLKELIN